MPKLWIDIIAPTVLHMSSYFWVPYISPPSSAIYMPISPTPALAQNSAQWSSSYSRGWAFQHELAIRLGMESYHTLFQEFRLICSSPSGSAVYHLLHLINFMYDPSG